jgi:CrcB protein
MTWLLPVIVVAGGLGAAARFIVDGSLTSRSKMPIPLGTLVINISGSFALGVATTALAATSAAEIRQIIGAGFLAGYTTFSTASVQTADLVRQRRPAAAFVFGAGMYVGAIIAAAAGLWLGALL